MCVQLSPTKQRNHVWVGADCPSPYTQPLIMPFLQPKYWTGIKPSTPGASCLRCEKGLYVSSWMVQTSIFPSSYCSLTLPGICLLFSFLLLLFFNFQRTSSFSVFWCFNIEFVSIYSFLLLSLGLFWCSFTNILRWMPRSYIYILSCLIKKEAEVLWISYWIKLWAHLISFGAKLPLSLLPM